MSEINNIGGISSDALMKAIALEGQIKQADDKEREKLLGDLASLPKNHPIVVQELIAIENRKQAEQMIQERDKNKEKKKQKKIKHAKKIEKIKKEEFKKNREVVASATYATNGAIDKAIIAIDILKQEIGKNEVGFESQPVLRNKMKRFGNVISSIRRGLMDAKINSRYSNLR